MCIPSPMFLNFSSSNLEQKVWEKVQYFTSLSGLSGFSDPLEIFRWNGSSDHKGVVLRPLELVWRDLDCWYSIQALDIGSVSKQSLCLSHRGIGSAGCASLEVTPGYSKGIGYLPDIVSISNQMLNTVLKIPRISRKQMKNKTRICFLARMTVCHLALKEWKIKIKILGFECGRQDLLVVIESTLKTFHDNSS